MKHLALVLITIAGLSGCKEKAATTDKPADKPADKPVDKPSEAPVAGTPTDPPAAGGWTTYTSKEGLYTIDLPTAPKANGAMVMSEFGATAADERTSGCGVTAAPVPNKDTPAKTMLEAMATGYKTDAKILEEKDIALGKHPGKHLVIENARHRKWIRLYVANDKLYINNCGGPFDRGDTDAPTALRVLESFKPAS